MNIRNSTTFILALAALSFAAGGQPAAAPKMDASGNNLLSGNYNFRHIAYITTNLDGDTTKKILLYGTIRFDGKGTYSLTGTQVDTSTGIGQPVSTAYSGSYSIGANGHGSMSNPIGKSDTIYGLLSSGVFIGGSTESGFNDLMIAAPASTAMTIASFTGAYQVAAMDVPSGDHKDICDFWFTLRPDGVGNLGNIALSGYQAGSSTLISDSASATYNFLNGVGTLVMPQAGTAFLSGNQTIYVSSDGAFFFGGSPTSFNMLVGVRGPTTPVPIPEATSLYYQAGIDHDASEILTNNQSTLSSYYGSLIASNGRAVNHQRINALIYPSPLDYTFTDQYALKADGTGSDTFQNYWFSADGKFRIGIGVQPYLGLSVAIKAPTFSGSGVYINPTKVVNAASLAPFTAAISPGELVTLSGTNLAAGAATMGGSSALTQLNGVQVLVNGVGAPVTAVSPTQVTFVVPFSTTQSIAEIKVINNGVASNMVTSFVTTTSPGIFTIPSGGTTAVAAAHANNEPITRDNPAHIGETVQLYLTGLGRVKPEIQDGDSGPTSPLSKAIGKIQVYVDGKPAQLAYSGLAPTFVGLYQLNFTVPSGIRSGDVYVDVSGPESDTSQAYISVAPDAGSTPANSSMSEVSGRTTRRWRARERSFPITPYARSGSRTSAP